MSTKYKKIEKHIKKLKKVEDKDSTKTQLRLQPLKAWLSNTDKLSVKVKHQLSDTLEHQSKQEKKKHNGYLNSS